MGAFQIQLASVPDRDGLVAEIWFGEELVAELRTSDGALRCQLYAPANGVHWDLPYGEWIDALRRAEERLKSG